MNKLLDRLLVTLEVRLEAFALLDVSRNCRLVFGGLDAVIIHYVLEGSGWLDAEGKDPVRFKAGDVVVLPARSAQSIRIIDKPKLNIDAGEHCAMIKDGIIRFDATAGSPTELRVLCGSLMPTSAGSFGLFDGLPAPLIESFSGINVVENAFRVLNVELEAPGLGTRALASSLMKLPLVYLVRAHLEHLSASSPLLSGVHDERLARTMAAVIEAPADPHTVASLATMAGMSRSSFAKAFAKEFKQTPMEYVAKARMHHAAELLRATDLPIKVIAASIGFASRSHFSRAFRKAYGSDPQRFRRSAALAIAAPRQLHGYRSDFALPQEPNEE